MLAALNDTPRSFSISTCPKAQFSYHDKDVQVTLNIELKRPKTKKMGCDIMATSHSGVKIRGAAQFVCL